MSIYWWSGELSNSLCNTPIVTILTIFIKLHIKMATETTLQHMKYKIHLSLPCGEPTALVLLDLLTAFDTIND